MDIKRGDIVTLRDGRVVYVTDAADQDPDAWRLYDWPYYQRTGKFRIVHEDKPETILIGTLRSNGRTVVTDFSEVVAAYTPEW